MNKESLGLYVFRLLLIIAIFVLLSMLYWSSTLLENNVLSIKTDLKAIKSDLLALRNDFSKIKEDNSLKLQKNNDFKKVNGEESNTNSDLFKNNLLKEDPFYEKTLPQLLGNSFSPSGTIHEAIYGKYHNLHPFNEWYQVNKWTQMCTISVAKNLFGKYETLSPFAAVSMELKKGKEGLENEYWVRLRDDLYWQPLQESFFPSSMQVSSNFFKKHKVTAKDFKFYLDAVMNPYVQMVGAVSARTSLADIEEIEIIDDLNFIIRWKVEKIKNQDGEIVEKIKYYARDISGGLQPLPCFLYQYFSDGSKIVEDDTDPNTYRTNSVWAQNFTEHWAKNVIVSCGPWIFDGRTEREVHFKRNTDFYSDLAALAQKYAFTLKESPDNIWQDFKNNQVSYCTIQPDQLLELKTFLQSKEYRAQEAQGDKIDRLDYFGRQYTYIGWNEAREYFASKKVRQALTMAIDRKRIIDINLNGMGMEITGPLYPFSASYNTNITPWPYDPLEAKRLLKEEGWIDSTGDGVVKKEINGEMISFQFKLTYYVKNQLGKNICEYVASALNEVGIKCDLNGVDVADLSASVEDRSFDAILLGWILSTPPENPRQLWYSTGANEKGSSNYIGFSNEEIDRIIDRLDFETDPEKRIALYFQFQEILHEEAPYVFLYLPKRILLYRDYLQNVFIPKDRQDLIPGANVAEPESSIYWIKDYVPLSN